MKCRFYPSLGAPAQHRVARELRAVVKADRLRESSFEGEILKTADDVVTPNEKPISNASLDVGANMDA